MKTLKSILENVEYSGMADTRKIECISYDSRKIKNNSLFIAINGFKSDGHDYIDQAIKLGAVAILVNSRFNKEYSVPLLKVKDTRKAMSKISANFFNDCSSRIKITGITGTNGKTTVTQLVNHILKTNKLSTSALGTLGFEGPGGIKNTGFTSSDKDTAVASGATVTVGIGGAFAAGGLTLAAGEQITLHGLGDGSNNLSEIQLDSSVAATYVEVVYL